MSEYCLYRTEYRARPRVSRSRDPIGDKGLDSWTDIEKNTAIYYQYASLTRLANAAAPRWGDEGGGSPH